MTCPLDAWNQRFLLDEAALIDDDAQLDLICCTRDERELTSIGISYNNCVFNSDALSALQRKYRRDGKLKVGIRVDDSAARIWVKDPGRDEHIEVINHDPVTRDLTFNQVRLLRKIQRTESPPGRLMSRAEARRRMEEIVLRAQAVGNAKGLARLLRLLGVEDLADRKKIIEDQESVPRAAREAADKTATPSTRAAISKKRPEPQQDSEVPAPLQSARRSAAVPPIFKVVRRST